MQIQSTVEFLEWCKIVLFGWFGCHWKSNCIAGVTLSAAVRSPYQYAADVRSLVTPDFVFGWVRQLGHTTGKFPLVGVQESSNKLTASTLQTI